jgi:hypothetical protein
MAQYPKYPEYPELYWASILHGFVLGTLLGTPDLEPSEVVGARAYARKPTLATSPRSQN